MIADKIREYLTANKGSPASSRWISDQIHERQDNTSRELLKLVKAGFAKVQTKSEFDLEYSRKLQKLIKCRRRRNYYWI